MADYIIPNSPGISPPPSAPYPPPNHVYVSPLQAAYPAPADAYPHPLPPQTTTAAAYSSYQQSVPGYPVTASPYHVAPPSPLGNFHMKNGPAPPGFPNPTPPPPRKRKHGFCGPCACCKLCCAALCCCCCLDMCF